MSLSIDMRRDDLAVRLESRRLSQGAAVAAGEEPAAGHDPDLTRQHLRFLHVVGANHQCGTLVAEVVEVTPPDPSAPGFEGRGRLLGQHQARPWHRGPGRGSPLSR